MDRLTPPGLRHKTKVLHDLSCVCAVVDNSVMGIPPLPRRKTMFLCRKHGEHVCCVRQQTCLLCHTADVSAVSHSGHVCCVTEQTCLLCHAAESPATVITFCSAFHEQPRYSSNQSSYLNESGFTQMGLEGLILNRGPAGGPRGPAHQCPQACGALG